MITVTEPGSDTSGMRDEWVVNGFKRYISNASVADVCIVYGISDPSAPGMSFPRRYTFMGRRGCVVGEVEFRDCRVPASHLLGERNARMRIMVSMFNFERFILGGSGIGAGCNLARMCDIRIALEEAVFAESFVKPGIVPGDGGACELAFTGDTINAQQALDYVSRVVPAGRLLDAAREFAGRIAANPPRALRWTKRLIREGMHVSLPTALAMSAAFQDMAHHTGDHREAIAAVFEKRTPDFNGR